MKKNPLHSINNAANQFKASIKSATRNKNPRYIYTEEDLGEGLLDAGVTYNYKAEEHNFKLVPWISMLRQQIS